MYANTEHTGEKKYIVESFTDVTHPYENIAHDTINWLCFIEVTTTNFMKYIF